MKKFLKRRNCKKWSEVIKLPRLYRSLILNDRCEFKQKKRTKYKRVERFDLAYRVGKRGTVLIPIFRSSYNSQSRIQNKPDGARVISNIERFNETYGVDYKLEEIPLKRFDGTPLKG